MHDRWNSVVEEVRDVCGNVNRRITVEGITAAIALAKHRWPTKPLHYITDTDVQCSGVVPIDSLDQVSIAGAVFLCVFFSDERATEILTRIREGNGVFVTPQTFTTTAHYVHKNEVARRALLDGLAIAERDGVLHFSWRDLANLMQALEVTRHIPGDYVEIGVYRGTSALMALHYMYRADIERRSFFLDTYEGFTYPKARESCDGGWVDTHKGAPVYDVARRLREYEGKMDFRLVKTDICDNELPSDVSSIAACNVDVDMYDAVLAAISKVAPRVAPGGIIVVEDPGHTPALGGAQLALSEFLGSSSGSLFVPVYLESGQFYLIRRA